MSGHSKWAQIKRQKGANDARKGVAFTRLAREIQVAAREGGPNPDANVRLRLAIQKARAENMPAENIKRSIEKATGAGGHEQLEEITYEGYGPGGAAILVQAVTDNRNRTVSEVRAAFNRGGGALGEAGSVAWLFEARGIVVVAPDGRDPDEIALAAIDAGAEDVKAEEGVVEVYTQPAALEQVRDALAGQGQTIEHAETTMMPRTTVELDDEKADQVVKLVERLEGLDDVQQVYTNAEFHDSVLAQTGS
jgi:YebC/PmpR family DNA-binding regulatory protein